MDKRTSSRTDLARIDAMKDEDIVYDEDTGPPWTEEELAQAQGFVANGLKDFQEKIKEFSAHPDKLNLPSESGKTAFESIRQGLIEAIAMNRDAPRKEEK